jgi:hypothetical protein
MRPTIRRYAPKSTVGFGPTSHTYKGEVTELLHPHFEVQLIDSGIKLNEYLIKPKYLICYHRVNQLNY